MSQQSEMADKIFERLDSGPVSAARLVRELRHQWGAEFAPSSVHGFIAEAVRCLLGREGVRLGSLLQGRFVPWDGELCEQDHRFEEEMLSLDEFLEDEHRYVFVKDPVQAPPPKPPKRRG